MRLRSLQWRLVWIFISITLVIIISVWFFLTKSVEANYYTAFKDGVRNGFSEWEVLKESKPPLDKVRRSLKNGDAINFFYLTSENRSYTIIGKSDGKIVESSDKVYKSDPDRFFLEVIKSENLQAVLAGKTDTGDKAVLTHTADSAFFDYAKNIRLSEGDYVLYFRYDREEWRTIIDRFNNIILSSAIIAVIASFILGYILAKTITVPIVRLMHKAQKIASGDFEQKLDVKSNDEIGKLTSAFNYMAKNLKKTMTEISSEKNKVETILNYMTDGVIAFNLKGEVIHSNPASHSILEVGSMEFGFNEFARRYELDVTLEEILYLEAAPAKEKIILINGKWVRVYFAIFTDEGKKAGGMITVLQDITEQQKLEDMRKDFVANVSHELRTPLTSIKSYAETLLEGALEDRETAERFLSVINSEADRMTRLVKDLLQLSSLDNRQLRWNKKVFSFVELVKSSMDKIQIEAVIKKQKLESYVIGDIPRIEADYDRIEQVVLNILSNAIKYTPEGGSITVYIGKTYSEVYMKVTDTGLGIPKNDLPRIFERFYRVDKARSRAMGGTGLGLSIAKEIAEAHGGSIGITSEEGQGTEVIVRLPTFNSAE